MVLLRLLLSFSIISNCFAQTNKASVYLKETNEDYQFYLENQSKAALVITKNDGFLKTGSSNPKVKEVYGFFKFKERYQSKCKNVTLDTVLEKNGSIQLSGHCCSSLFMMDIWASDKHNLHLNIQIKDSSVNRVRFSFKSPSEECIYGMGEQYTHSNLKGKKVPIWVEEQGIGAGDQPITSIANLKIAGGTPLSTYAPIPFYLSDQGYSVELKNTTRSIIDFRKKDITRIEVWDNNIGLCIRQYEQPLQHIEAYTAQNGRLRRLPDWTWGTIVGLQGGKTIVENIVDSLLASKVELSAIWIQDWVGRRRTFVGDQLKWYWQADTQRYPQFEVFCHQMQQKGIAVLGYINPMLTNDGQLYQEADQKGYLVKNHHDQTYVIQMTGFKVGLIDLTNPAACTWIKSIIKNNMIAAGLKGWMADFGEALPWDAVLHSGISAEEYHNQYPVDWARVNREAIEEAKQMGKVAFFSRSSFSGGSRYSTFYWAGDQMTSWQKNDGLRSIVPALTSSGICGMSVNHADVGAFAGFWKAGGLFQMKRNKKLLKRHIELGAFSPVFRTHEGIIPNKNIQVYTNEEMRTFYAHFSRLRTQLIPYLKQVAEASYQKGHPMVRHLFLQYPNDKYAQKSTYQFMLGPDMLAAPKLKKNGTNQRVYLPEGQWIHLFDHQIYTGAQYIKVKAELGKPPIFIKKDSQLQSMMQLDRPKN